MGKSGVLSLISRPYMMEVTHLYFEPRLVTLLFPERRPIDWALAITWFSYNSILCLWALAGLLQIVKAALQLKQVHIVSFQQILVISNPGKSKSQHNILQV
jgi:hypothetical protein